MKNNLNRKYIFIYNQLLKECDTIYHNAALKAGISDCAFWILYTLQDSDHVYTQSEICEYSFMPKQTVNSALKKLEKENFLSLNRVNGKIGKIITLTEKGNDFISKHIIPFMDAEEKVCAIFSESEKESFLFTFRALVENLKKEIGQI